jgi:hypothetical protein
VFPFRLEVFIPDGESIPMQFERMYCCCSFFEKHTPIMSDTFNFDVTYISPNQNLLVAI